MKARILSVTLAFMFLVSSAFAELSVHFIDVGQGDSILIQCDGETMLVDAGDQTGGMAVKKYLNRLGIEHLDHVVLTHVHDDHIAGMQDALRNQSVSNFYYSPTVPLSFLLKELSPVLTSGDYNALRPQRGDILTVGEAVITFLTEDDPNLIINDRCLVIRVDHGENSFLLMADAEFGLEEQLLNSGLTLQADVLKIGHHGGMTSTGEALLKAVAPSYAVISVGADNAHGHPHDATLQLLKKQQIPIFRTDLNGNIVFTSDGTDLRVEIK